MAIQDQASLTIAREYAEKYPESQRLHQEAQALLPGGVTHMARTFDPFPLYVDRCVGAHKWDVDGNRYIDYWMGHGAMLLGHAHPAVVEAVREQVARGTHAGGSTRLEIDWARLIMDLVPCAESVKFTSSGTEATLLALRAARAYTGKSKIIKFEGHFHGWHDYAMCGVVAPYDVPMSAGIPEEVQRSVMLVPFNDPAALTQALDSSDDIAAVIAEPGGSYDDTVPTNPAFLKHLREATTRRGVVLIFDEVVTGFRYAVGGAQEYFGVIPDMATLAKVMAGGLNGGAVVGRREIMEVFEPRADPQWNRYQHGAASRHVQCQSPLGSRRHCSLKAHRHRRTDKTCPGDDRYAHQRHQSGPGTAWGPWLCLRARLDLQNFYRQGSAAAGALGFQ